MEYVGLQAIANAVGVSYHELWVAVRAKKIILRIDRNRTGEPVVATDTEINKFRIQLQQYNVPNARSDHQCSMPNQPGADDDDILIANLIASALRLEARAGYELRGKK